MPIHAEAPVVSRFPASPSDSTVPTMFYGHRSHNCYTTLLTRHHFYKIYMNVMTEQKILTSMQSIFDYSAHLNFVQRDAVQRPVIKNVPYARLPYIRVAIKHPLKLFRTLNMRLQLAVYSVWATSFVRKSLPALIIMTACLCDKFVRTIRTADTIRELEDGTPVSFLHCGPQIQRHVHEQNVGSPTIYSKSDCTLSFQLGLRLQSTSRQNSRLELLLTGSSTNLWSYNGDLRF